MATAPAFPAYDSTLWKRRLAEQTKQALLTERSTFDATWRELADYYVPRRTRFFVQDRNKGDRRNQNIIDSAPRFSARTLASGLHAGLTSPARPWMQLATPDPDLNKYAPVKEWLWTVTRRMLDLFQRSNLYNVLPICYGDMGVFGTGAFGEVEDLQTLARFYSYPLGSFVVGLDSRGLPGTFARDYQLTVEQVVEEFVVVNGNPRNLDWSKASTTVKNLWTQGNYTAPVDLTWYVSRNKYQHNPRALEARYAMPYVSCHYEQGRSDAEFANSEALLRESGYRTFPVLVPRWDVTGEDTYGTDCPGVTALGDTKQLQIESRFKSKMIAKGADPPLKGPHELKTAKVSMVPGGVTFVEDQRTGGSGQGLTPIHEIHPQWIQVIREDMAEVRDRVRRAFYEDLFLMLSMSEYGQRGGTPITAREVQERHEEKLLALGPVLERLNDELLDPLVDRTFVIMLSVGAIPEPPEELRDSELKVDYISILSQAQKLVGVSGHDRFLQSTISLAEVFPEVRHKVKVFRAIDDYAEMLGVDPHVVRDDDEAQAMWDAEQKQAAQAAQAEQMKTMGQGAQALANAPLQQGQTNALEAIQRALTGGSVPPVP